MTTSLETLNPTLRAAIISAVAAFEGDIAPLLNLSSADTRWRIYGRRAQMTNRFDGRRNIPSLPVGQLGWRRAPWGIMG